MIFTDPMDHPNLVVVHYASYAGGKFWINCLAHHPGILPLVGDPTLPDHSWLFSDLDFAIKQKLKIQMINASLPLKQHIAKWTEYELGDAQMWGGVMSELIDNSQDIKTPFESKILLDQYRCFVINHNVNTKRCMEIKNKWPLARHIVLHNHAKFQSLAMSLKQAGSLLALSESVEIDDAFYIDVDNNIFDQDRILSVVAQCLKWFDLEFNDLHPNLYYYINEYLKLHQQ